MSVSRARFAFVRCAVLGVPAVMLMAGCMVSTHDHGTALAVSAPYAQIQLPPDGVPFSGVCASYTSLGVSARYLPTHRAPENGKPKLICEHAQTSKSRTLVVRMPTPAPRP